MSHCCLHCGEFDCDCAESMQKILTDRENGKTDFNQSGSKYLRKIILNKDKTVDVYAVLIAFNVTCPARQHAIKKLLCSGIRGKGDETQDLKEAKDAIERALQLLELQ